MMLWGGALLHDAMGGGDCFMILVQTRNFLDMIVKTCGEPDLPKISSETQTKGQGNFSPGVNLERSL